MFLVLAGVTSVAKVSQNKVYVQRMLSGLEAWGSAVSVSDLVERNYMRIR